MVSLGAIVQLVDPEKTYRAICNAGCKLTIGYHGRLCLLGGKQ